MRLGQQFWTEEIYKTATIDDLNKLKKQIEKLNYEIVQELRIL